MHGLISVIVVVFMVAFLILKIIFKIRKVHRSLVWVIFVCGGLSLFAALFFAPISNWAVQRLEWRETEKTYLVDMDRVVTYGKDYVFIPIMGHEAKIVPIKGTDIFSNGNIKPFLVKYQVNCKWLFYDRGTGTKWQVYLPPDTLVAGERI